MRKGKHKSVIKTIFKWLGIILGVGLIACVIAYFADPGFKEFINNSWTDLWYQITK